MTARDWGTTVRVILHPSIDHRVAEAGMVVGREGDTLAVAYARFAAWPELVQHAHELLSAEEIAALCVALRAQEPVAA